MVSLLCSEKCLLRWKQEASISYVHCLQSYPESGRDTLRVAGALIPKYDHLQCTTRVLFACR